jgi:hypothetical protein
MKKKDAVTDLVAAMPSNPGYHNRFGFPYKTTLSFLPLLNTLEQKAADPQNVEAPFLRDVLDKIKAIPELTKPVEDLAILKKYRKEVDLLMSSILPSSMIENLIIGAIIPFQPVTVYGSQLFKETFNANDEGLWDISRLNATKAFGELVAFCGLAILENTIRCPLFIQG